MKIVKKSELLSFDINLPRADYPSYEASKTYQVGDKVTQGDYNYYCTKSDTKGLEPQTHPKEWVSQPTNATSFLHARSNVVTKFTDKLIINLKARYCNCIVFYELDARKAKISIPNALKGDFNQTFSLRADILKNFTDYLFSPFATHRQYTIDFPLAYKGDIRIEIEPNPRPSKVGYIHVGYKTDLGLSLYGGSLGIRSFTKKERNAWGDMEIQEGRSFAYIDAPVHIDEEQVDRVYDTLRDADKTANVYIIDESGRYKHLNILGVFKELEIPIRKGGTTYNLRLEGVI